MILDNLSFAVAQEVAPNIVEIIANEGVEVTDACIEQLEQALIEQYSGAYAILVNRVNTYSHTHHSMERIAQLKNLAAIAVVVYNSRSAEVASIHRLYMNNIRIFENRYKALIWLRAMLAVSI